MSKKTGHIIIEIASIFATINLVAHPNNIRVAVWIILIIAAFSKYAGGDNER